MEVAKCADSVRADMQAWMCGYVCRFVVYKIEARLDLVTQGGVRATRVMRQRLWNPQKLDT